MSLSCLCRYWHVPSAECVHEMKGHTAAVTAVAVTGDGSKTVSASSDATVKVWNTDQSSRLAEELCTHLLRYHH